MATPIGDQASVSGAGVWRRLPPAARLALLASLAAGVVLAAFLLGQHNPRVVQEEVRCLSAEGSISCELDDGWMIGVPRDVRWDDAHGRGHEGGRPDCLPPSGIGLEGPVRVAWTSAEVDGQEWRQVLSVTCLSSSVTAG